MFYMFMLYSDPSMEFKPEMMADHFAVAADARKRGQYVTSEALGRPDSATTVRIRNNQTTITDGPFAETKEVFGGFYVLDCKDLDEALEYAKRIPDARIGAIEIRPVMNVPGWEYPIKGSRSESANI